MIKVNLAGIATKKAAKAPRSAPKLPASFTPFMHVLIVAGFAVAGYWWYASLNAQSADLDQQIRTLEARKAQLEAVIKQDQAYESIKKKLEERVRIVEGLQKNQISPIRELDQLAEAVQKTRYVWLSSIEQKDAVLNMSGSGTSLNAIADFYSNLYSTGYFKNVDVGPTQASAGNFTFSMKADYAPPAGQTSTMKPAPVKTGPRVVKTAGGK